ncbi:hypothetical protein HPB52_008158 [Rhipicephalus sanguineus]|uniref:Sulfatase N-terminal domain-containing protein n=1 Tax=Rhipicephalus sanguineus TaxID=34632 RepID=A0A9D4SRU2_RHISA|nr:hypothetical protein HPB52_008158 [Rhipicephalus sanguineus]
MLGTAVSASSYSWTQRPFLQGWDDPSFHGSSQIPTPNLDALAADGVILNNFYVLPACTPSRSAFMTGRYPIRMGTQGYPVDIGQPWGLPLDIRILPEYLRDLGYELISRKGMIDTVDESVGKLFETLQEAGMLDNSVVLFSSDNGGTPFGDHSSRSFNWPLRGLKMSVWEGSTKVPAFVWSPLLKEKQRVSNQLMHLTDWFTTFYRLAGQ